ncbi:hypothetical protein AN220_05440, partial [Streptomyces nanshensis]
MGRTAEDADARLDAVVVLSQAMAAAQTSAPAAARPHPHPADDPETDTARSHRDIAHAAAEGARA